MAKYVLFLILLLCSYQVYPQTPRSFTSSEILSQIKRLHVLGSVLYIAAHPDDENTRLLAYLANDKLYRTGYLSLTRGDGGQNLIGDEQGVELGLIRTQELLSARRIDGAEQFFSRAYDFGYSKNPEEAFKIWNKEKILSDIVWIIRKFQPDVILTRFPTTGEGGHGHHTASAILAGEAFEAAADPNRFSEQFKYGVKPWKAKRLLWNTFNFGSTNTQSEDQLKIEVGGFNPLLGKSYGEIAAESRSQHKSQGFGVPRSRGSQLEYFKTIKGDAAVKDLFDGIDVGWSRILQDAPVEAARINDLISELVKDYSAEHPEKSVPLLTRIHKLISTLPDGYWKTKKLNEITSLMEQCSGLFLEAATSQQYVAQGDSLKIDITLNNRGGVDIQYPKVIISGKSYDLQGNAGKNSNVKKSIAIQLNGESITEPYWLEYPLEKGSFVVNNQQLIGKPENDAFSATLTMMIDGEAFTFQKPIQYKSNDPVKGELYQPLVILPKVEVNYDSKLYISENNKPVQVMAIASSNTSSPVTLAIKNNYSSNVHEAVVQKEKKGELISMFTVPGETNGRSETLKASASDGVNTYSSYRKKIQYDHIPTIVYYAPAEAQLVAVDLKISGKQIGYIPGAGDKVPASLELMGYTVTTLSAKDITLTGLKKFDAIVTGVRAYNVDDWLSAKHDILMNYVKEGGTMLVQYNVNGVKASIGPWPFTISRSRVTDEDAAVQFLTPEHPVLNYPNKITQDDFIGWIQERSTYNAENADPKYQYILGMADPGENEQKGSLLIGDYGNGRFIYSGLVFFRELPAGVPGAYRLIANLLARRQMTTKGLLSN